MGKVDKKVVVIIAGIVVLLAIGVFMVIQLGSGVLNQIGKTDVVKFADLRGFINNTPRSGADISGLNLRAQADAAEVLPFVQFNLNTVWPPKNMLPEGFDPLKILDAAKNPGLGIDELHKQGLTGKGIGIGIMEFPIYTGHDEYKDRIKAYQTFGNPQVSSDPNAQALVSELAGKTLGVAPGANVYYAAVEKFLKDQDGNVLKDDSGIPILTIVNYVNAMDWFIYLNKSLPIENKIRMVVVPIAPDNITGEDNGTPFTDSTELWKSTLQKAANAGIIVFDLTNRRQVGSCWLNNKKPNDLAAVQPGYPDDPNKDVATDYVLMPTCPRTFAEEYVQGQSGYRYMPRTGTQFILPYAAGVAALGFEAAGYEKTQNLTLSDINRLFFKTAYVLKKGIQENNIVNPKAFIKAISA